MTRAKKKEVTKQTRKTVKNLAATVETDLLGHKITAVERDVQQIYKALKKLARRKKLPPCVSSNTRVALAAMWQVVNDLNLEFEQLYDLGS